MTKVMLIDDDPGIRDVFELALVRAGYAVTVLADGGPLQHTIFEEPDIFIIDKRLQGIDGLDICRWLKAREGFGATPVIIFSASPSIGHLADEAGASACLEKPVRMRQLLETVQECISKRKN